MRHSLVLFFIVACASEVMVHGQTSAPVCWRLPSDPDETPPPNGKNSVPDSPGPRAPCGSAATTAFWSLRALHSRDMWKWSERSGGFVKFRSPSNAANGNTRDSEGRLVSTEQSTRRITRTEKIALLYRPGGQLPGQAFHLAQRHRRQERRLHLFHRSAALHAQRQGKSARWRLHLPHRWQDPRSHDRGQGHPPQRPAFRRMKRNSTSPTATSPHAMCPAPMAPVGLPSRSSG